jgi:TP901 family phage tail tape measure protein
MASETFRIAIDATVNDKTGPGVQSAQKRLSGFDKSIEHTKDQLDRLTSTGFHIDLDAVDRATATIQNVETRARSFAGKAWNFTVGIIDKATAPLQGIINLVRNPVLQAGAIFGVSVSLADTVGTYGAFEESMSNVKAISGATGEEFEKLTAKAKEEGATTKFTAKDSADAFGYMAMAGWKTEDMLNGIDGIMSLAAASNEDLATTSDIVTDALTAFGLQASDSGHFADVLAQASANANTNVGMMGESFKYVAPVAGTLGYSIEDVSLALGLMANNSIKGSMAGTSLKTSLANLAAPTDKMQGAMDKYGISLTKRNGEAKSLSEVLDNLRSSLGGLSKTEQTAAASTLFGKEAMAGMLAIIKTSDEDYKKLTAAVNNADGASQQMADTMLDNMNGSFTLLQSAVDGAKIALGERLSPYLREFATWVTGKMPLVEDAIGDVMDRVDAKIENLHHTIAEFTASDEWANADIWGKLGIAWDKIVAEPFDEWWNGSGRQFFADRAAGLGRGLGSGITAGFLALLGIDPAGAIDDGAAIGANFVSGFMDGLDFDGILDGLKTWAENHKAQVAAIGAVLGFKLVTGAASAYSKLRGLTAALGLGGGTGTGSSGMPSMGGSFKTSAAVMNVTAQMVVLKSGNFGAEAGSKARQAAEAAFSGGTGSPSLPSGGALIPSAGTPATAGALPGATRLLGDGKATFEGTAVEIDPATLPAKGLTSANSWLGKFLQKGSTQATMSADGTLTSVTGGVGGTLGTVGTALGSHATTAAGTAAAGGASILGGILGLLGIGAGVRNLYRGTQTTGKDAQNEYSKGGTKIGMVGAGAAAGAAVGTVVPVVGTGVGALVGAGIGGLGALGFGDKIGQALSDALDEGGALDNLKQTVGTFFTSTLPEHWTSFWDGVGTTFSETIPYAIGYALGKTKVFFTNTLPEHWTAFWDGVGEFWTEDVPAWVENTGEKAAAFFTETLPTKWTDFWTGVGDFWTKEVPAWVESSATSAANFFTVTLPAKWTGFWSGVGDKISGFFTNARNAFSSGFSAGSFTTGGGASGGGGGRATPHATGGIMTRPHVGLVAEDGPEAIIPLGSKRRGRGIELLHRAAAALGVSAPSGERYDVPQTPSNTVDTPAPKTPSSPASGGLVSLDSREDDETPEDVPTFSPVVYPAPAPQAPAGAAAQPVSIPVEIGLNPQFVIQGTAGMSPDEIIATVKSRIREMVDDISDELAERLARVFANMPA